MAEKSPARCLYVVPHGRDIVTEVLSGGPRISRRWGRQLSREGAPTYDFAKFSQIMDEIERIWTPGRGGGLASLVPPLDPPLVFSLLLSVSFWWLVRVNLVVPFGFLSQVFGRYWGPANDTFAFVWIQLESCGQSKVVGTLKPNLLLQVYKLQTCCFLKH